MCKQQISNMFYKTEQHAAVKDRLDVLVRKYRGEEAPVCFGLDDCSSHQMSMCFWLQDCSRMANEEWEKIQQERM